MKKFIPAFIFLSIITILPSYTRIPARADARSTLSHSSNQFAFALMHAALPDDSTNRLISPVGVYLSLSLLYNGANKATKDSLAHVLQVSDMDINQLNALSKSLLQQVSLADKKARFSMANSILCNRKKLRLVPSFGELGENFYYSNVQALPFNGHATAEKINRWTTQNTDRQFPAILQNANPNDMVYLTNACCFSSTWQHPFDSANTQMDFFYPTGGHRMIAPFMRKLEVMKAYTDTAFTMVELPYGDFSAFSLYIVLPNDLQQTVRQFIASFQEKKLYDAIARMNDQWVDLSLPKWEHSSDTEDMRQALRQIG